MARPPCPDRTCPCCTGARISGMFNELATVWFRWLGGRPAFRVYGKARYEKRWRVIDIFATHRRDLDSRWPRPFFRGTCITWTTQIIAVGWDFAEDVLREQLVEP